MAQPALRVDGARRLRASLKAAGIGMQDLKAAHRQVAEMVATRSAPNAPRRTGRLAATVRPSGTQSAAIVRAGRSSVPYAGPIHWGHESRGIKAQPWLAEAAERSQTTWENTYLAAIEAVIATVEGTTTP